MGKRDGAKKNPPKRRVTSRAIGRTVTLMSVVLHRAEIIRAIDVAANEQRVMMVVKMKNLAAVA